jgi:hypothetical protein
MPARASIVEPPSQSGTQPAFASWSSSDPTEILFDPDNERWLPAPVPAASIAVRRRPPALPIGILIYLLSVGLVATATVGVFFGIGFFLLVQPSEPMTANAGTRDHGSASKSLLYSLFPSFLSDALPADGATASVPIEPATTAPAATAALAVAPPARLSAVDPALPEKTDPPPSPIGQAAGSAAREALPVASAPAAEPAPDSSALPAPSGPGATASETAALLARGDIFLRTGDVTSARLFYERAADAGDRQAAMRMGATFDPAFLGRAGLRGARGDPAKARFWYRHALDVGAPGDDRQAASPETK